VRLRGAAGAGEGVEACPAAWFSGPIPRSWVRDEVLEKPLDAADALRMLRKLQGGPTRVVTSVALVADEDDPPGHRRHQRRLRGAGRPLPRGVRRDRRADGQGGGIRIQGYGAALVERIDGDFFSVMELPVRLLLELLEQAATATASRAQRHPAVTEVS